MKITLEPLLEEDYPLVVEWINAHDKDFIFQWAGNVYSYPLTEKQMKEHYCNGINSMESGVFIYKILEKDTQDTIGTIQLGRIDMSKHEGYIGRFLMKNEDYRGKGIGTAVLNELVRIGFEQFNLKVLKLYVFHLNTQAIRCYKKVGFIQGEIQENVYQSLRGDYWNRIEMVLEHTYWKRSEDGIDII